MTIHKPAIRFVFDKESALEARDFLLKSILIASDIETLPELVLMNVVGYSGLHEDGTIRTFVFTLYNGKAPSTGPIHCLEIVLRVCQEINASGIPFVFQNGTYDLYWFVRYGMPVANYAYDSMTMFWAIYPELPKRLDFISSILLTDYVYWKGDRKSDDFLTYLNYNGLDCDRTLRNCIILIQKLIDNPQARQNFWDAHLRTLAVLGVSMRGLVANEKRLEEHHVTLKTEADQKLADLRFLIADPAFNPASPKQKSHLLYTLLGGKLRNAKGRFVDKASDASTGATVLRSMRSEGPILRRIVNGIMAAGEPAKQISNVIIGTRRSPWGRLYTSYAATGTTTTRLSSSASPLTYGSNVQNIRKGYRDFICSDGPDSFLLDFDLSAGDDVFVSFESGDPKKIELFKSGRDAHSTNATLFFPHWNYDDVVSGKRADDPRVVHPITGIRQISKKLSHGCNYLMAALTLLMTAGREAIVAAAKEIGFEDAGIWTQEALAKFCESREILYRNHYTRFQRTGPKSWYGDLQRELERTGGFLTPFNYFQRFLGDKRDQNVLRAVAATAGQAGTAGRINMAMVEFTHGIIPRSFRDGPNPHAKEIPRLISRERNGVSLRLQTHDSFTFNVNTTHPHWEEGVEAILEVMTRPVVIRNSQTGELETFVVKNEGELGWCWGKGLNSIRYNSIEGIYAALEDMDFWNDKSFWSPESFRKLELS